MLHALIPYGILTERLLSLFDGKLSILIKKLRKGHRSATRARAAAAAGRAEDVGGAGRGERAWLGFAT